MYLGKWERMIYKDSGSINDAQIIVGGYSLNSYQSNIFYLFSLIWLSRCCSNVSFQYNCWSLTLNVRQYSFYIIFELDMCAWTNHPNFVTQYLPYDIIQFYLTLCFVTFNNSNFFIYTSNICYPIAYRFTSSSNLMD